MNLIKLDLPRARRPKGVMNRMLFKGSQSWQTKDVLIARGWRLEGQIDFPKGTEYGLVKSVIVKNVKVDQHIVICDAGPFPYHLGDTSVYPDRKLQVFENRYQRVM
jgi:hypothetical protein